MCCFVGVVVDYVVGLCLYCGVVFEVVVVD